MPTSPSLTSSGPPGSRRAVPPIVLTIAGSDSSGGAGIQADLKTIAANGGYGASAITAVTAQNTLGITLSHDLPAAVVRAQIDAVFADLAVAAVKSGMLASAPIVEAVAAALEARRPPHYVLDPVLLSTSGFPLLASEAAEALRRRLLPLATLVTPNASEAHALTGLPVRTPADAEAAGRRLLENGAAAVLVKGGHLREHPGTDVLVTAGGVRVFAGEPLRARHTHGTGCALSAAIATQLAHGHALAEAIARAKAYVTEAIRDGLPIGHGVGPTDPFFYLRRPDCAHWIAALLGPEGVADR